MNILVTGATGKVGSRLGKRLAARGHRVRGLVRKGVADGVETVVGDLLQPATLAAAVRGVDAIVHCAAFFRGATPEEAHATNDLGTQHLAKAAIDADVPRFVFTSTGNVYGGTGGRFVGEDAPCNPTAPYPVSKLAAEKFLLGLDLDVRILRLPFVYGDGDRHIEEAVPMMRHMSPDGRMSIAHHVDVAQAVALVLEAVAVPHRIYNVTDDDPPTRARLFASVGEPPPDGTEAEKFAMLDTLMDGSRLRADLGFAPEYPSL